METVDTTDETSEPTEAAEWERSLTSREPPRRLSAPTVGRRQATWSGKATSPPTTSRNCSTSPTLTATSTWTSRASEPWCRSSGVTLITWSATRARLLDALQELTRLAVLRETGERSRLMLDIAGWRAAKRAALTETGAEAAETVKESGSRSSFTR